MDAQWQTSTTPTLLAGRYALGEPLGRGRSTVYRATDTRLERQVAVKQVELLAGQEDAERVRRRALREAQAAARLNNPCVVTVFDVVEEAGSIWLVMELVDAPSLSQVVVDEGPVAHTRAAALGLDVLTALEAAHVVGVVHRDVKPANVLVQSGDRAKLTDFGVATIRDDSRLTTTGLIVGSPSYMSPEQARGAEVGPPTDLWALGALLYFATEGEPPFQAGSALATASAVVHGDPRPAQYVGPLTEIITRLLTKDPAGRPSAGELRAGLSRVARGERSRLRTAPIPKVAAPAPTPPEPTPQAFPPVPATPPEPVETRDQLAWAATGTGLASTPPTTDPPPAPGEANDPTADLAVGGVAAGAVAVGAGDPDPAPADPEPGETPAEASDPTAGDQALGAVAVGAGDADPGPGEAPAEASEPTLGDEALAEAAVVGGDSDPTAALAASEPEPGSGAPAAALPADPTIATGSADEVARDEQVAGGPPGVAATVAPPGAGVADGTVPMVAGVGAPSRGYRAPEHPRSRLALLVAAAVVVLLLVAGISALTGGDPDDAASDGGEPEPSTSVAGDGAESSDSTAPASTTPTTAAPSTTAAPPPAQVGVVPPGWTAYPDPSGRYSIAYPPGWEAVPVRGSITDFRDPATGAYLRVDWTDTPGADPAQAWRDLAVDFAGSHANYQELGIAPTVYRDYNAAVWEFRYGSGQTVHATNLGFVTGGRGYALLFQAPEELWASSQTLSEQFRQSFQPVPQ